MPKIFHPVARLEDIAPGELKYVEAGDRAICLANVNGDILALDNTCTHERAPLSEGTLRGQRLQCPLHGGAFNVFSGEPEQYPASYPVKTYSVRVEGGVILVGIRS
ncbi:MAG: non-heme iron oxygenase ferredoxin subunit [Chloroflexota bacterium]|nr:non-heme iron oxygenase ferredoxin subunit [Chloroflexota bacterium]